MVGIIRYGQADGNQKKAGAYVVLFPKTFDREDMPEEEWHKALASKEAFKEKLLLCFCQKNLWRRVQLKIWNILAWIDMQIGERWTLTQC